MSKYSQSLRPMAISELMTICSAGLNGVTKHDVAPLRAVLNLVKLEYSTNPAVYRTTLSLLYQYDPALGQPHASKTIRHLQVLLSETPDLADYAISLLPQLQAHSFFGSESETAPLTTSRTNSSHSTNNPIVCSPRPCPPSVYGSRSKLFDYNQSIQIRDQPLNLVISNKDTSFTNLNFEACNSHIKQIPVSTCTPSFPTSLKPLATDRKLSAFKEYKKFADPDENESLYSGILRATLKRKSRKRTSSGTKRRKPHSDNESQTQNVKTSLTGRVTSTKSNMSDTLTIQSIDSLRKVESNRNECLIAEELAVDTTSEIDHTIKTGEQRNENVVNSNETNRMHEHETGRISTGTRLTHDYPRSQYELRPQTSPPTGSSMPMPKSNVSINISSAPIVSCKNNANQVIDQCPEENINGVQSCRFNNHGIRQCFPVTSNLLNTPGVLSGNMRPRFVPQTRLRFPAFQLQDNSNTYLAIPGAPVPVPPTRLPIYAAQPFIDNGRYYILSPGQFLPEDIHCKSYPSMHGSNAIYFTQNLTSKHASESYHAEKITEHQTHDITVISTEPEVEVAQSMSLNQQNNDKSTSLTEQNQNINNTPLRQIINPTLPLLTLQNNIAHQSNPINNNTPWVINSSSHGNQNMTIFTNPSSDRVDMSTIFCMSTLSCSTFPVLGPANTTTVRHHGLKDGAVSNDRLLFGCLNTTTTARHVIQTHANQTVLSPACSMAQNVTSVISTGGMTPVMSSRIYNMPASRQKNSTAPSPMRPTACYPHTVGHPRSFSEQTFPYSQRILLCNDKPHQLGYDIRAQFVGIPFELLNSHQSLKIRADGDPVSVNTNVAVSCEASEHLNLLQKFVNKTCTKRRRGCSNNTHDTICRNAHGEKCEPLTNAHSDMTEDELKLYERSEATTTCPPNISLPSGVQLLKQSRHICRHDRPQKSTPINTDISNSPELSRYFAKLIKRPPNLGIKDLWMPCSEDVTDRGDAKKP